MAVKVFTESGKGRKKCPATKCSHYVAAVTKKCPCGHNFVRGKKPKAVPRIATKLAAAAAKEKEAKPKFVEHRPKLYKRDRTGLGLRRTAIPSGSCPVKLSETGQTAVYAWIEKVCKAKEDIRTVLMASALKYYAREFFDSSKGNAVCQHIDSYWVRAGVNPPDEYEFDDEKEYTQDHTQIKFEEVAEVEEEEETFDWD